MDPRHLQRIKIVQNLFAFSFNLANNLPYSADKLTKKIIIKIPTIDKLINTYAPRFPIVHIAKVDLSILRLGIYELIFAKKIPEKVIIDEAIELSKDLSGGKSYTFINAVLGKVLNQYEKSHKNRG